MTDRDRRDDKSGTIFRMTHPALPQAAFPTYRPRRLRRYAYARDLVRENALTLSLIHI